LCGRKTGLASQTEIPTAWHAALRRPCMSEEWSTMIAVSEKSGTFVLALSIRCPISFRWGIVETLHATSLHDAPDPGRSFQSWDNSNEGYREGGWASPGKRLIQHILCGS